MFLLCQKMILTRINTNNITWNPWFGCFKISEACENCYIRNLGTFEKRFYSLNCSDIQSKCLVAVGLQSDFFLAEADKLRPFAWNIIRNNPQILFEIYTKRVDRIMECVPNDWGDGWNNVIFSVTVENQKRADERIPILINKVKCKHKWLNCAPLLEQIDLTTYLVSGSIEAITTSGEREVNNKCRRTKYEWYKSLSDQCAKANIHFELMHLGAKFDYEGNTLCDTCACFKSPQAHSLKLDNLVPITFNV